MRRGASGSHGDEEATDAPRSLSSDRAPSSLAALVLQAFALQAMSTGTQLTLLFVVLCWAFLSYTLVGSLVGLLTEDPLLSTVALVIWFVVCWSWCFSAHWSARRQGATVPRHELGWPLLNQRLQLKAAGSGCNAGSHGRRPPVGG